MPAPHPGPHRPAPGGCAPEHHRSDIVRTTAPPALDPAEGRFWAALGSGAVLAFAVIGLFIIRGPHVVGDYATETDFYGGYARGAALIQHGVIDPARYAVVGPAYELALAAIGALTGDLFLGAQLLSLLAALGTLLAWGRLLRPRLGAMGAAAAVLLLAADPTLLRYAYSATTDSLALALQSVALLLAFGIRAPGPGRLALAGAVAGLAVLTRYTGIVLLPAGVVAAVIATRGAGGRGRLPAALAASLAGFALPVAGWLGFMTARGVAPRFEMYHLVAFEAFARARGVSWDEYERTLQPGLRSLGDVLRHDPGLLLAQLAHNLWRHAWLDATVLLGGAVAVTAVVGLARALADGGWRRVWPLALIGGMGYLVLVPVTYSARYSLMLLPVELMFAAMAFTPAPRPRASALALAALLLVTAASARGSYTQQREELATLPRDARTAADTLRRWRRPGDAVIARKPHLAWLAGVESVPFPDNATFSELMRVARERHARWLFVSAAEAMSRPANLPLLDTTGVVPGLTPRCVTADPPSVLYEIGPGIGDSPGWLHDSGTMALRLARARLRLGSHDPADAWVAAIGEVRRGAWGDARATLSAARAWTPDAAAPLALVAARDSSAALNALVARLR